MQGAPAVAEEAPADEAAAADEAVGSDDAQEKSAKAQNCAFFGDDSDLFSVFWHCGIFYDFDVE